MRAVRLSTPSAPAGEDHRLAAHATVGVAQPAVDPLILDAQRRLHTPCARPQQYPARRPPRDRSPVQLLGKTPMPLRRPSFGARPRRLGRGQSRVRRTLSLTLLAPWPTIVSRAVVRCGTQSRASSSRRIARSAPVQVFSHGCLGGHSVLGPIQSRGCRMPTVGPAPRSLSWGHRRRAVASNGTGRWPTGGDRAALVTHLAREVTDPGHRQAAITDMAKVARLELPLVESGCRLRVPRARSDAATRRHLVHRTCHPQAKIGICCITPTPRGSRRRQREPAGGCGRSSETVGRRGSALGGGAGPHGRLSSRSKGG
jgi:hypothetical protein